jgi:methionyl-tRNA formyltransferase
VRILFMGTAGLSCDSLQALVAGAPVFDVVGVVTRPDQPRGRGLKMQASPVKALAERHRLPVLQPDSARDDAFLRELQRLQPDLIVVTAYGQILPAAVLELPRHGCLNVHTSLLPRYRGAAPIQWALLNGDAETGVTIMKMDAGLDTGDVLAQAKTAIHPDDDAESLHARLGRMGAELLAETIPDYTAGRLLPQPQPTEGVSRAPKIRKQDGRIDWNQPARAIWNRVRALVPWPGAFTCPGEGPIPGLLKIWQAKPEDRSGEPGRILSAAADGILVGCGSGSLQILTLQREGGRRMSAGEFLAGHPLAPGLRVG